MNQDAVGNKKTAARRKTKVVDNGLGTGEEKEGGELEEREAAQLKHNKIQDKEVGDCERCPATFERPPSIDIPTAGINSISFTSMVRADEYSSTFEAKWLPWIQTLGTPHDKESGYNCKATGECVNGETRARFPVFGSAGKAAYPATPKRRGPEKDPGLGFLDVLKAGKKMDQDCTGSKLEPEEDCMEEDTPAPLVDYPSEPEMHWNFLQIGFAERWLSNLEFSCAKRGFGKQAGRPSSCILPVPRANWHVFIP